MTTDVERLSRLIEALLLAADQPLSLKRLQELFADQQPAPQRQDLLAAVEALRASYAGRGFELAEVASGYRLQVLPAMEPWVARLWEEKPPRYSRALLETLAIIAYRQPITRADIEDIRGVSVSSQIIRTLQEREWVQVVGHRDVPGRPAMFGTTRKFLDYFGLRSLDQLPTLAELRDLDKINPELLFGDAAETPDGPQSGNVAPGAEAGVSDAGDAAQSGATAASEQSEPG